LRFEQIIINPDYWDDVQIIASKTPLEFNFNLDCYTAQGCIANLSMQNIKGIAMGSWEECRGFSTYHITAENKPKLLKLMLKHPPGRRILSDRPNSNIQIPRITCYNLKIDNTPLIIPNNKKVELDDTSQTDTEMQDVLGGNKVSYTGTAEISPYIIDTGLEVPTQIYSSAKEALNLNLFSPEIRPYIKRIFLDRYPNVVSLHSLDAGDVSKTLGFTSLRLIPGEKLPRHKRIYQLSPQDVNYMEELLEQFIRFGYVRRAPIESTDQHLYGMSTYLVPRRKLTDIARLVIDFSPLTSIIQSPPNIIPDISVSLQNLQNKAMDLRYAYLALKIDEESKPLTTFLTPNGAYQWLSIPTGASCSPAYFVDAVNRILHYKPEYDENGSPIFDVPNKVRLKRDVMKNSFHYFDDIICSSENKATYKESLDYHFNSLERIVERLSFHNVKLSVNKSEFARSKILFLGWIISHNFIIPDPRRIEKIKSAEVPKSKKEVRSFLGLVNSIRRVIPFNVIQQMQILSPLTSSSKNVTFEITKEHINAFNSIKELLLKEPLYCNLIDEKATKYLWVDAASSSGCLGAVLAQRVGDERETKVLPTFIDLENPVHQIIYDKGLNYEPCKLYTSLPIVVPKPSELKTVPPKVTKKEKFYGHKEDDIHNSLFWSLFSIYALYNCKIPNSINEVRVEIVKEVKKNILGIKLKDQSFNNEHRYYREYLTDFEEGKANVDKDWIMIEALAKITHRCIIILSTLEKHGRRGMSSLYNCA
jgi:hypothetical protein